jgi:inorganic triphosphatase YgiF
MEIEAKFILPTHQAFVKLAEVESLAGLHLKPALVTRVRDRYLDTAEAALLRAGYACRLRAVGDARLLTLKSLAPASDALHRREEVQAGMTPAQAAGPVDGWPPSTAVDLARTLSAGQPLELLFELEQERHVRVAARFGEDRPVVEISLDRVRFDDADPFSIYELEAELLPAGEMADLEILMAELVEGWAVSPQAVSKFERGLALCCPELLAALGDPKPEAGAPA